jgi:protein-tyrosine kinase
MERIKQAIEKAKTLREGQVVALESAAVGAVGRPTLVEAVSPARATEPDGHHRQTQVVALNEAHLESQRIVAHRKSHPASWAFDLLRTQVLQKMDENGWRTLAVTSPSMQSGKTVVAVNLAIGIAQQTERTSLLVDLDLRRPRVASALGLQNQHSLNEVIGGECRVDEALVSLGIPRFVVLPTQSPIANSAEVLGSSKVALLMSEFRERYADRIVIMDLPPVLAADDVLNILPRIDCVLLVVGNGGSTQKEIEESINRLSRCNLVGVVLNKDDAPNHHEYY